MATAAETLPPAVSAPALTEHWGWLLALGIVQVVGGAIAIAVPALASLAAVVVFGAALLASAIFQLIHALRTRKWPGSVWYILGGLLYAAAGILVLLFPLGGILTLTAIIATVLIAEGAVRGIVANAMKPKAGWGWWLASGIASVLLGVLLFIGWPATAPWAIGLLLGINLIFSGATNASIAITSRRARHRLAWPF